MQCVESFVKNSLDERALWITCGESLGLVVGNLPGVSRLSFSGDRQKGGILALWGPHRVYLREGVLSGMSVRFVALGWGLLRRGRWLREDPREPRDHGVGVRGSAVR